MPLRFFGLALFCACTPADPPEPEDWRFLCSCPPPEQPHVHREVFHGPQDAYALAEIPILDTLDLRWNAPLADGRTITRFLQICLAGEEIEDEDCTATYQPVPNSVRLIEDVLREEDELHVVFTLRRQP